MVTIFFILILQKSDVAVVNGPARGMFLDIVRRSSDAQFFANRGS
jgi:hypothetical protein